MDTIFAPATARGRAGVCVVRISGPNAFAALRDLAGPLPEVRVASLRVLRDGEDVLDQALVLRFAAGASFTGEDVVELHLHGSVATLAAVLRWLGNRAGLRLAEAGEFTRRALENGCLDLAQVEGLADLIDAETEAQRRQAMRVLSGAIGARAETWRRKLIRAAALIEATIDFVDEDVPVDVRPEVLDLIAAVQGDLTREAAGAEAAERIRQGFEVAIVGLPNAGKSTLLNALAGREAAITSEHAGTTRDVIEVRMDIAGLPVLLLDTAGLRDTEDSVEALGIERALTRAQDADLRVFISSDGQLPSGISPDAGDIVLVGKDDTYSDINGISGRTRAGIPQLVDRIGEILGTRSVGSAVIIRERHRLAILLASRALESAATEVRRGAERAEIAAEELRSAVRALDALVGRVDVEDVLDEIFSSFCIGK